MKLQKYLSMVRPRNKIVARMLKLCGCIFPPEPKLAKFD